MATTIYLSSTYEDLKYYRRVLFELLRENDSTEIDYCDTLTETM
jgi:hypothetical protein